MWPPRSQTAFAVRCGQRLHLGSSAARSKFSLSFIKDNSNAPATLRATTATKLRTALELSVTLLKINSTFEEI